MDIAAVIPVLTQRSMSEGGVSPGGNFNQKGIKYA